MRITESTAGDTSGAPERDGNEGSPPHVLLIDWPESDRRQATDELASAGIEAWHLGVEPGPLASAADDPASRPGAIVIDLSRRPAQGRDVGIWLRRRRATRSIPVVFSGGTADKVADARAYLPDATYCAREGLASSVRDVLEAPPAEPVVPSSVFAPFASRPLAGKLGIRAGMLVSALGADGGQLNTLGELPDGVTLVEGLDPEADVVLCFVPSVADLERRTQEAGGFEGMLGRRFLWVLYPKRSSGLPTDLTQDAVRSRGLAAGLVDFKVVSYDDVWTGVAFTRRRSS